MYVDDKIVNEFIKRDRTAQWFRSYLIQAKEEQDQPPPDAVYIPEAATPPTSTPTYTYIQKVAILLEAYRTRQLFLNRWEYDFLTDNQANLTPTAPQIATVEKFWRRITI